ncbi:hypothetical protein IGI04_036383 [Brassica rapa subsp. trilocularis]|uniref:Amino acid transporter transmembrane domain-containing protein n=1 Tax=Brassica rapa subsp. trilocularis TaxID=1813537 RepID=A0ABQ7LHC6_BRACM|nr:hypothetical protein IGI04_036383 [Brassica rapa subsp. trilocularis]
MDETRPIPHKRENLKLGTKRSAEKFPRKVTGKFTGDNPAIDLNPAIDSVGPSSPTLHTHSGTEENFLQKYFWLSVDDFGPRGLSVQYTCDVRVYPSAHTGRPWLSVTLVLGLSMLALPLDCLGDFGPRGLSVQYTHDVCGCPPAHTGRPWLSVSTHMTSVAVRVCPCVSGSTHRTSVAVHHILALPVDCSGDFGPRGLSVQYTQDVRGCPSAHTGRPWVSVSTHMTSVAVCVCPSAHTGCLWLSISTHIIMLVLRLSMLTLPVHCSDDFGPRGLSVQYTQDVCGCPSAHTGRPCVSVNTHRTSVAVHVCPSAHTGRPWLSISKHISMLVLGLSMLTLPVDCSGDFGHVGCLFSTHRTSVGVRQHTQVVCGCPCVFVCVRQHTHDIRGCPSVHISARGSLASARWPFPWTVWVIFGPRGLSVQYTQDVCGCPWLSVSTHRMSVAVRVCPCVSINTPGRPWVSVSTYRTSVCVRVCPSAHTGRMWLSISKHISTLVLGLSMLALPVGCLGDFGPRGLSVQYTQEVCGCLSTHTGHPWVSVSTHRTSVAVRVCLCVSVSTHKTYVAVHQYTYHHVGPWTQHANPSRGLFG